MHSQYMEQHLELKIHTNMLAMKLLDDFLSLQNLQITPTHAAVATVQSSPKNNNNIILIG